MGLRPPALLLLVQETFQANLGRVLVGQNPVSRRFVAKLLLALLGQGLVAGL